MLNKILSAMGVPGEAARSQKLYNDLIRHEAKIGGELFGPVPEGGRREFFCLDEYTWVWHEEWKDNRGNKQSRTTRYNVRPSGITKTVDGQKHQPVTHSEALRLLEAVKTYERRVNNEIYQAIA